MKDFFGDSQSIYYLVAACATIIGLLCKIGVNIWRAIIRQMSSLKEDRRKLDVVFSEVTTNHGSSIKDKVNALEKSIAKNTELTEKIFFRQRWLMENHKIPIFESDNEGKCTWVNEEYSIFFGKSPKFFLGHGWKNVIHPDDRKRVEEHWTACVRDGIDAESTFRTIIKGKEFTINVIANRTESGGYIGSITIKECAIKDCEKCNSHYICDRHQSIND